MINKLSGGIGMNSSLIQSGGQKTLLFVSHGETFDDPNPFLTREGSKRAQRICDNIAVNVKASINLIVTAPTKASIQTSLLAFPQLISYQKVTLDVCSLLQPINTDFESHNRLIEAFPQVEQEIRESNLDVKFADLKSQASSFLEWLSKRTEMVIVIVCHAELIHELVGNAILGDKGINAGELRMLSFHNGLIKSPMMKVISRSTMMDFLDESNAVGML